MPITPTVFSQVMDFLPMVAFRRCVGRYQGNKKVQSFTCLDQFLCLAFAQLTYRESLRDIDVCGGREVSEWRSKSEAPAGFIM